MEKMLQTQKHTSRSETKLEKFQKRKTETKIEQRSEPVGIHSNITL